MQPLGKEVDATRAQMPLCWDAASNICSIFLLWLVTGVNLL